MGQSTVATASGQDYLVRPLAIALRFFEPPQAHELRSLVWPKDSNQAWARVMLAAPVLHPLLPKLRPNPLAGLLKMRIKRLLKIARREGALPLKTAAHSPDIFRRQEQTFATGPEAIALALAASELPEQGYILRFIMVHREELDDRRSLCDALLLANAALQKNDGVSQRQALESAVVALYQARARSASKLLRWVGRPSVIAEHSVIVPNPTPGTGSSSPGVVALHPAEMVRAGPNLSKPLPGARLRRRDGRWSPPIGEALLGLYLATKPKASGAPLRFSSFASVEMAYQNRRRNFCTKVRVGVGACFETSLGRALVGAVLPAALPFALVDQPLSFRAVEKLFKLASGLLAPLSFERFARKLWGLGLSLSTQNAPSISMHMLAAPKKRPALIADAQKNIEKVNREYNEGLITFAERHHKTIDIWSHCVERVRNAIDDEGHPLIGWLESGATALDRMKLGGAYGLIKTPKNRIEERPIMRGFIDGFLVHDYFMHAMQRRHAQIEAHFSRKEEHALARRLWGALHAVKTQRNCGTKRFEYIEPLCTSRFGDESYWGLERRIVGRFAAEEVRNPKGRVIVFENESINEEAAERIAAHRSKVAIYTALGCAAAPSVCARCYGAESEGNAGARAALELAARTMLSQQQRYQFMPPPAHCLESVELISPAMGWVRYQGVRPVWVEGALRATVSNTHGVMELFDLGERLRARYLVLPGDWLFNEEGRIVAEGTPLLARTREREIFAFVHDGTRDRLARPQLESLKGVLRTERNYNLGLTRSVMSESAFLTLKTRDWTGDVWLPQGAHLLVDEGAAIRTGTLLARAWSMPGMIMTGPLGGKEALQNFFEGRATLPAPVLARVSGRVWHAGGRRVGVVTADGQIVWHSVHQKTSRRRTVGHWREPRTIEVMNGAYVEAGTPLTSGAFSALALSKVLPKQLAQRPMVEQLLRHLVYSGAEVPEQHAELLVRRMLEQDAPLTGIAKLNRGADAFHRAQTGEGLSALYAAALSAEIPTAQSLYARWFERLAIAACGPTVLSPDLQNSAHAPRVDAGDRSNKSRPHLSPNL